MSTHSDNDKVEPTPGISEVLAEAVGTDLDEHFKHEDDSEHFVKYVQSCFQDCSLLQLNVHILGRLNRIIQRSWQSVISASGSLVITETLSHHRALYTTVFELVRPIDAENFQHCEHDNSWTVRDNGWGVIELADIQRDRQTDTTEDNVMAGFTCLQSWKWQLIDMSSWYLQRIMPELARAGEKFDPRCSTQT